MLLRKREKNLIYILTMIVGNGNDGATESRSVDVRLYYGPNTESSGTGRININVRRRTTGKHDARNIYIYLSF